MSRMKLEWECSWEPRKVAMVQANMQRIFSAFGGVSNIGNLKIQIETGPPQEEKPRENLQLICMQYLLAEKRVCGHRWESEFFQPCPSCSNRAFVRKIDPKQEATVLQPDPPTADPAAASNS